MKDRTNMGEHKLAKDLIFFHMNEPGTIFTFKAGNLMNEKKLKEILEHLKDDMKEKAVWVEERRKIPRSGTFHTR